LKQRGVDGPLMKYATIGEVSSTKLKCFFALLFFIIFSRSRISGNAIQLLDGFMDY